MPDPAAILMGLERIANAGAPFAVAWHVVVAATLAALVLRARAATLLSALVPVLSAASVSAFAWTFGNPFNGASFALLAAGLALTAWRAPAPDPGSATPWARALGATLVAFSWCYPHFLVGRGWLAYLIASPLGLIPCPTLSLVVGLSLLGFAPARRLWDLILAGWALFYAVFGALRLGVVIDVVLLAGATGVLARGVLAPRHAAT